MAEKEKPSLDELKGSKASQTATEEEAKIELPLYAREAVRAKFVCTHIHTHSSGSKDVHMRAVSAGSDENKEFSDFTPNGSFMLQIAPGKSAADFFAANKEYYLDITAAE